MKNVDLSASSPLNRFTDEHHLISTAGYPSRKIITPNHIPFFQESLVLEHISDTGVTSTLLLDVHYKCVGQSNAAFAVTGKDVYHKVLLLDAQISGTLVFKEYQTFTVPYTTVEKALTEVRDVVAGNVSVVHDYNASINNKPVQFNPKTHTPTIDEFVGLSTTKTILDDITAVAQTPQYLELPVLGAKSLVGQSDLKLRNAHTVMSDSECGTGVGLDVNDNVTFTTVGSMGQAIYQSDDAFVCGHISVDKVRQMVDDINTNGFT